MASSSRSLRSRVYTLLGVEPGEGRAVALLVTLYFMLAAGFVFVQTTAFGLFIDEYGARNLPWAYLSIAAFSSSIAYLYFKLSERLEYRTLLYANLAFLALTCMAFWLGLRSSASHWFIFFLPFWFQTLLNLANLLVWPLAGRMFDVRQAKRLFGLVGSGNWIANILGGFIIAPILALTGTANMYLLAAFAVLAAGLVLAAIFREGLVPAPVSQAVKAPSPARRVERPAASPFRHPYYRLIFAYVLLWWLSFYFIDNIFFDRAGVQFASGAELAAFIGRQISVIGVVAIITSTLLTGRIIRTYGLRAGLLGMPVLVTVCTLMLVLAGLLGAPLAMLFWIAAVAKTLNLALGFSLSQAAGTLVYQPILGSERIRTQTIAEGMVQPGAIGLAGLLLLLFNTVLHFNAVGLSGVFLVIAALWLWTTWRLAAFYPQMLSQALVKRSLGDGTALIVDADGLAQLRAGLDSRSPTAALYAIHQLEEREPQAWHSSIYAALPELIVHPAPEVRRLVIRRILELRLTETVPWIRDRLPEESDPETRSLLLRCLAAFNAHDFDRQLDVALESEEDALRQGALEGMLESNDASQVHRARAVLDRLVNSDSEMDRLLAIRVLSETTSDNSAEYVRRLAQSGSAVSMQALVQVVVRQDDPRLLGWLIAACNAPETAAAAEGALVSKGAAAFPALAAALAAPAGGAGIPHLLRALASIGGQRSVAVLVPYLSVEDAELRTQALRSLSTLGYRTRSRSELLGRIRREIDEAAWITAAISAQSEAQATVLVDALRAAFREARTRVMLLLSFGFDREALLRAQHALETPELHPLAFALETVDALLPAAWKPLILPLIDRLPDEERLRRWQAAGVTVTVPGPDTAIAALLDEAAQGRFSRWLRLCAIHVAACSHREAYVPSLQVLSASADPWVVDAACHALARIKAGASPQGETEMLSQVEKVLALKSASLFSQTPDNVLADVASRVQERSFSEGELIFSKGDRGDSLYIIVSGKVQVWDGDRLLNELSEGSIFGELALLDPAPRSASVKAVEPVHLLELDEQHFQQVLAERPEVSSAIIRVLTSYLRTFLRDGDGHDTGMQP